MQKLMCSVCKKPLDSHQQLCQNCNAPAVVKPSSSQIPPLVVLFVLLAEIAAVYGIGQVRYNQAYDGYRQGLCQVGSEQVQADYISGKNGGHTNYVPSFTVMLTLSVSSPQQVQTTAYASGPWHEYFYNPEDAQVVVNQYQIGQTYTCWYQPLDLTDTVFARRARPLDMGIGILGLIVITIFLAVLFTIANILLFFLWRCVLLLVRRKAGLGTVLRKRESHERPKAMIIFRERNRLAQDEQATPSLLEQSGALPMRTEERVRSFPLDPARNAHRGTQGLLVFPILIILSMLLILAGFIAAFSYPLWSSFTTY